MAKLHIATTLLSRKGLSESFTPFAQAFGASLAMDYLIKLS
jgi:hypothetical protein